MGGEEGEGVEGEERGRTRQLTEGNKLMGRREKGKIEGYKGEE